MKRSAWWLLIPLVLVLAGVVWWLVKPEPVTVHFNKTEPIAPYQWKPKEGTLRVAMISVLNKKNEEPYQKIIVDEIGKKLGRPVMLLRRNSYAEVNDLLASGDADIAFMSTGAYMVYGRKEGLQLLAMQERDGRDYYYGYVIVPASSPVQSVAELSGKKFLYVDPLSYSGYLGMKDYLKQHGLDENMFESVHFTYGHEASIRAISKGLADGAVVDSMVYDLLKETEPAVINQVRIIGTTAPVGTGPIVASLSVSPKDLATLRQVAFHLHENPTVEDAMQHLMIDRFVEPRAELYGKGL